MTRRSGPDVLDLLLPDVEPVQQRRAEKLVTFLRLLADDARGAGAELVGLDLSRARGEMERVDRAHLLEVYEDLLLHHLAAALPPDSFADFGPPRRALQEAWSELELHRRQGADLPGVPAPGEQPIEVARRLLEAVRGLGDEAPARKRVWNARWIHAARGPLEGEAAYRRLLEAARRRGPEPELEIVALRGVAECLLDLGAVTRASAWLDEHLALVSCDEGLARLHARTLLLRGELQAALETALDPRPEARLPRPLAELRARVPAWQALLAGEPPALPSAPRPIAQRGEVGATALLVFALGPGRETLLLQADVAPGLRGRVEEWLRRRDGVFTRRGEPEHRLVTEARTVHLHREGSEGLRGALAPSSLALALVPVLDDEDEVAGWVHVECEHHLLPALARLEATAARWRTEVLARAGAAAQGEREPARTARSGEMLAGEGGHEGTRAAAQGTASAPCGEAAQAFVARLGMKSAQRRWWCYALRRASTPSLELVAEGGERLEDWRERAGGGRARRRAWSTAGAVAFDEPDARLSVHRDSCSGVVVSLVFRGEVHGLFAVESTRRRDFRPADVERLTSLAAGFAVSWRAAQFRAWHAERFGHDVYCDPERAGLGSRLFDLPIAGRSRAPVALVGAEGSGRKILARWIHFEGPDPEGRCDVFPCAVEGGDAERRRLSLLLGQGDGALRSAPCATLTLQELELLPLTLQVQLAAWIEARERGAARGRGPRLVATLRAPVAEGLERERLHADLARRFLRLELYVPPLRERRDEIPPLVELLARRFAREEGVEPPAFEDAAMGLLWRQPWEGNVQQLENLVYKLVLFHPGARVGPDEVRAIAVRFRLELLERIGSRRPSEDDLRSALRVTRKASGASNKTRAALYLGWDPDTLVARMEDAGIPGEAE